MCDWDGDHILVIADKAVLKATEGLPDVPLYYDMQKAKAQQIDNESIYKTLVDGFKIILLVYQAMLLLNYGTDQI